MLVSASPQLCLGFANTRYWRGSDVPTEELADPAALLAWLVRNGVIDAKSARGLACDDTLFAAAIDLRETLYRLLAAQAAQSAPRQSDVGALQVALAAAPQRNRLTQGKNGFAWQLDAPDTTPASLLAPVLWSAGDVLTGDAGRRLRLCGNENCLYLFVDNSRSGVRRWCDMKACGNRAKAHRHYLKSKMIEISLAHPRTSEILS